MTVIKNWTEQLLNKQSNISTLVAFRILFGAMMFASTLRFILKGWVDELYVNPTYYFTYYGFEWIKPLSENGMYVLFGLMLISSIFILLGFLYRINIIAFFLIFTYIELIDKTNYLNHYYFVSLISFILIFLPAHRYFSLDSFFGICKKTALVPVWTINILKLQIGLVYFFAGIAKLNYHWLIEAQPLTNWLKHQWDFPFIGELLTQDYVAYLFSWGGALFDLTIFFILINRQLRIYGYILVVLFHVMTSIMFPIGVFPLVMICSTLIFFSTEFHTKIISFISSVLFQKKLSSNKVLFNPPNSVKNSLKVLFVCFICIQLFLPFRYLLYPGKLFWTEQGYRFSWRVMLIEKAGYTQFYIHEPEKDRKMLIQNCNYLTPQQEKMMSTQPDMILQFAKHLNEIYKDSIIVEGDEIIHLHDPKITADVRVSLFNKGNKIFIDPNVDLSKEKRGFKHKDWIINYED